MGTAETGIRKTGVVRSGNKNDWKRREIQRIQWQMQQKLEKLKRRMNLFGVLTWGVLFCMLFFLITMYLKIERMNAFLEQEAGQLQLMNAEGTMEAYQAAPPYRDMTESGDITNEAVQKNTEDYPELWGMDYVDRPLKRTEQEVLECLKKLSGENAIIEEIYENRYLYPAKMLEALANNPEMAGFVSGYPEAEKKASGGLTEGEKEKDFPLFLQWDPRWGYAEYGDDSNIGLAGCGPTCLSMVLFYLTGDESLTPDAIADYGMANGYYVSGTGTAWALLEEVPARYGIEVVQPEIREQTVRNALDRGDVLICSMGPGDFTAAGHFIVVYGYDKEGYLINDPNCVARSRQHWSWNTLEKQMKNMWLYSK